MSGVQALSTSRALVAVFTATLVMAACVADGQGAPDTDLPPRIAQCQVFPTDHIWNARVDNLPLDSNSAAYVNTIGAGRNVHPDFGAGLWESAPIGIPVTLVDSAQPRIEISFYYPAESDPGPYPLPLDAAVEGGSDRHVILVDMDECMLFEVFDAELQPDGSWDAGSGAVFDLNDYALRPAGWTSADAAGLAIMPGLVRYDEVAGGEIRHALRFTAPQTRAGYVWPARHEASDLSGDQYPPLGQRFRLRADFDASGFSPDAQVIVTALKTYGMMLADNGSSWFISGVPDERWDNAALRDLRNIRGADFEAVDVSGLMVSEDSGAVRQ